MSETPTCPKCGSTNFINVDMRNGPSTLRCHPGCENVWDADDLVGQRFSWLRDEYNPPVQAEAEVAAGAPAAANEGEAFPSEGQGQAEPSAEAAMGEPPEAA